MSTVRVNLAETREEGRVDSRRIGVRGVASSTPDRSAGKRGWPPPTTTTTNTQTTQQTRPNQHPDPTQPTPRPNHNTNNPTPTPPIPTPTPTSTPTSVANSSRRRHFFWMALLSLMARIKPKSRETGIGQTIISVQAPLSASDGRTHNIWRVPRRLHGGCTAAARRRRRAGKCVRG